MRRLTASHIKWALQRVRQKDALHKEVIDIEAICLSHEALRADLDEARAQLAALREAGQAYCAQREQDLLNEYGHVVVPEDYQYDMEVAAAIRELRLMRKALAEAGAREEG